MVLSFLFATLCLTAPAAEDRTLDEFKQYVTGKLQGLTADQLDRLAGLVDTNGDGVISDAEFEGRMAALQQIRTGTPPERRGNPPNPDDDDGNDPAADAPRGANSAAPAQIADGPATILLITAEELADAWKPWAEWKTQSGKATRIVTVESIAEAPTADNIQEKIRLLVRDQIDNHGTRWVVLGGDSLPGGEGLVPGGHTTVHSSERRGIPTDIVYLSETNWDADGDGVYGEWKDDREAISYPDGSVGLGRVPVRTAADVAAFTEKVIAYESSYPTSGFATQMIYTCTDSPAYPKVRNSWDGYLSKVWDGADVGRFFSTETPWDGDGKPGSHALSAENLVELINSGTVGKMHIHGHGLLPQWMLERSTFTEDHVGQLTNQAAYPLITTVSCNTGEYDNNKDPSIVESMIRQPGGGTVAIVAPIRTGKAHFANRSDFALMVSEGKLDGTTWTMTHYWVNGLGHGLTTGEALMKTKADMAADALSSAAYHLCICELNLLGDPTLDMRAEDPRTPTVDAPAQIAPGEQSMELTTDAPGATVCLWKGHEVYVVAQTDEQGKATIEIEPVSAGSMLVTISGPSLNTVTRTIDVR